MSKQCILECLFIPASNVIGTVAPSAHAPSHSDGGGDEITVENLATAAVDTTFALQPDGVGGVTFGLVGALHFAVNGGLYGDDNSDLTVALNSIQIGNGAVASGIDGSVAIGTTATASGNDGSVAVGRATVASALSTVAIGDGANATGSNGSIAIGNASVTPSTGGLAIGNTALAGTDVADQYPTAIGGASDAEASGSLAVGAFALASGDYSIAIGGEIVGTNRATASALESIAIGRGSEATGIEAVVVGSDAFAVGQRSLSLGHGSTANGTDAIAIGPNVTNFSPDTFKMGWSNTNGEYIHFTDFTPAAGVKTGTHSIPVTLSGATYYILLSNV